MIDVGKYIYMYYSFEDKNVDANIAKTCIIAAI